jgi:NAD+ diphosphatase
MNKILEPKDQKFCSWCGGQLIWQKDALFATCEACSKNIFINPRPCTVVFVMLKGKVLLLRRSLDPKKGFLDLPGGFVDVIDESVESGAIRELSEELSLNLTEDRLVYLGSNADRSYIYQGILIQGLPSYFFILLSEEEARNIKLDHENSEFLWVDINKIDDYELSFDCFLPMVNKLKESVNLAADKN